MLTGGKLIPWHIQSTTTDLLLHLVLPLRATLIFASLILEREQTSVKRKYFINVCLFCSLSTCWLIVTIFCWWRDVKEVATVKVHNPNLTKNWQLCSHIKNDIGRVICSDHESSCPFAVHVSYPFAAKALKYENSDLSTSLITMC